MKYLDLTGLTYLWSQISAILADKANANEIPSIEFVPSLTEGELIGTLTLNDIDYPIYVPQDTDTHYEAAFGTSESDTTNYFDATEIENPYLKLIENNLVKGAVQLVGGDNITITRGTDGKITISAINTTDSIQIGNILAQESATGGWAFVAV